MLGASVAIEGDTIVAGASQDDGPGFNQGSVYTFARTGGAARTQTAKLSASDGASNDTLGSSVAIDGDTIVAGAPGDNGNQGSAYTFASAGAVTRSETARLVDSDGAASDFLGRLSVAIDGDTIIAGAFNDDVGANADQGSATIFFAPGPKSLLTVTKAGDGVGTVSSDPAGIDCGVDCSEDYGPGTMVTLTASFSTSPVAGGEGSTFGGFSGCDATPTATTCTVTMDQAKNVTATFVDNPTLTVAKAGSGSGTVTSSPAGLDCGATCAGDFPKDSMVTLTAAPAAGSDFAGFTGAGCTATAATCEVSVDQAKSVTATFALTPRTLTVSKAGDGSGTVTSDPAGIDCGADCDQDYDDGTKVALTANAAAGSSFAGFTGAGCTGAATTCEVTMDQAQSVTATFAKNPPAPSTPGPGPTTPGPTTPAPPAPPAPTGDGLALPPGNSPGVRATGRTASGGLVIVGTGGDDTIVGTGKGDRITCGGGRDTIRGGSGSDSISGGSGSDRVSGGSGDDTISGSSGNDRVSGDSGNDRVNGNPGSDRINGGAGKDRLSGSTGNDRLSGNSGKDRLAGGPGNDSISGGPGNDSISGGPGNDSISGGSGRDRLSGGSGKNKLKQ